MSPTIHSISLAQFGPSGSYSHVISYHMSRIDCHVSLIPCHMSPTICRISPAQFCPSGSPIANMSTHINSLLSPVPRHKSFYTSQHFSGSVWTFIKHLTSQLWQFCQLVTAGIDDSRCVSIDLSDVFHPSTITSSLIIWAGNCSTDICQMATKCFPLINCHMLSTSNCSIDLSTASKMLFIHHLS